MRLAPCMVIVWLLGCGRRRFRRRDEPYGRHQFDDTSRSHWSFKRLERPEGPFRQ